MFGIIKSVIGFRQFMLRGLDKVRGEWSLVTMAWNMKRMFALRGRTESQSCDPDRFGVFARCKPCVGIARAKSSEKSNPCSASGALVPANATRRQ